MALQLNKKTQLILHPTPPHNFDANFHKPSHFPTPDRYWQSGHFWITMFWRNRHFGLRFENCGTAKRPKIQLTIFSRRKLSKALLGPIFSEIGHRFNLYQDVSEFCTKFASDPIVGPPIRRRLGMKPVAFNSLYEMLNIYIVLQNATVRRSVQMMSNLFNAFGEWLRFDGKLLASFWSPHSIVEAGERRLRELKLGYRAKALLRISKQFADHQIDEEELRKSTKENIRKQISTLYGIGPASLEYLLFEYFYFLDELRSIPPWEQKVMSMLLFKKPLVPVRRIIEFFKKFRPYEKLAFHYLWEDLFWQHQRRPVRWLTPLLRY